MPMRAAHMQPPHPRPPPRALVTEEDRQYIRQALELAKRALGQTHPNPAVGCVLVKDGQVGAAGGSTAAAGQSNACIAVP